MPPTVYVFNPLSEGYIGRSNSFTPTKHQAQLTEDLTSLPQFLGGVDDIVLVTRRPSEAWLDLLGQRGFPLPEFIEFVPDRINAVARLAQRELARLRPWAWGPDSLRLFKPLFAGLSTQARPPGDCFNDRVARLYSKSWSAAFLSKSFARLQPWRTSESFEWLCSEQEIGTVAHSLKAAIKAVATIRGRGHHRVVIKAAYGVAGQNAIRLWEPELLPAQVTWLMRALKAGQGVVVEPWLERVMDFSVQLEMLPRGLSLCGYTGLLNDRRGQFMANWAEPDYARRVPAEATRLLDLQPGQLEHFFSQVCSWLEAELRCVDFLGPIGIDAFVYRTAQGNCRLKPVVEINPRYTMGRLTLELMRHAAPGCCGRFRLISRSQAQKAFIDFASYAASLVKSCPWRRETEGIQRGSICLNDPAQAQVCLATFEVGHDLAD